MKLRDGLVLVAVLIMTSLPCVSADTALPFIVQAHRGAGNLAPENTLESFELGWSIGAIPEADVRTTSDGVLVAFHDNNFKRLVAQVPESTGALACAQMTWAELSNLDVGAYKGSDFAGQRIPRLADVFKAVRKTGKRQIYLDIKDVSLPELARLARIYHVESRIILASTNYDLIREWKALVPQSGTLHWMGGDEASLKKRLADLRTAGFADITQLQIHVRVVDLSSSEPFSPSSQFICDIGAEVKSRGILYQVLVIGSDKPEAYHRLMDLGVQSFATDDPVVTIDAMKAAGAGGKPATQ